MPSLEALSGYTSGASLSVTGIPEDQVVHHESGRPAHDVSGSGKQRSRTAERLLAQVAEWLHHEKQKALGKKKHHHHHYKRKMSISPQEDPTTTVSALGELVGNRHRANSLDSESSEVSFDRLQRILDNGVASLGLSSLPPLTPHMGHRQRRSSSARRRPNKKGLHRTASSDTEYVDGDVIVPSCDAVLDNSRTMSYTMGKAGSSSTLFSLPAEGTINNATPTGSGTSPASLLSRRKTKEDAERLAWLTFKSDIIRLAHTLRLKGWRRVPLGDTDAADAVSVERLSGALTNAVYVVTPPSDLSCLTKSTSSVTSIKMPEKLLLRIYGPQVEHLIDRDIELAILRRLAKKKIGPRLLGTFTNGRFEQYFNASPLNPTLLRDSETSIHIARRMRELHEGIELLDHERFEGPGIWKNWYKWVEMAEKRVLYLDNLVQKGKGSSVGWKSNALVCGVKWRAFRCAVEGYQKIIDKFYQNLGVTVRDRLVFAHNDTQYGNILRIHPGDDKSPLLQPINEHKQLVVIDFEYAAANTPGLEFANHFTEWTYNYHDEHAPHACRHTLYPKPDEQRRFLKAYVDHKPDFSVSAANTPLLGPVAGPPAPASSDDMTSTTSVTLANSTRYSGVQTERESQLLQRPGASPTTFSQTSAASSSSIVEFMLDARIPPGGWREEEYRREGEKEHKIRDLMAETRLWRLVNSAQWVAWGIVQAKIKGYPDDSKKTEGYDENKGEREDTPTPIQCPREGDSSILGGQERRQKLNGANNTCASAKQEIVETGTTAGQVVETTKMTQEVPFFGYENEESFSPHESDDVATDEFDYLAYAHDRAMFVLGDCIQAGLIRWEDIDESIHEEVKIIKY